VTVALITGITGQDGGYLAEQLAREGSTVHGTLRAGEAVPAHLAALGDAVRLLTCDLTDPTAAAELMDRVRPDDVYNLAGLSSVALSWQAPVQAAVLNGVAVTALLEAAWRLQDSASHPVRFLQASSGEIFAGAGTSPQDEQTRIAPLSPYGAAKAFAHHAVHVYRARGLHAVNAVLYNHESPRRPPTFVTRKISMAVAAVGRGRDVTLHLGDLAARRDWGWAPEYVDGMTRALAHPTPEATGVPHSVAEFVATAFAHVGVDDWRRHAVSDSTLVRPTEAAELVGRPDKALRELGWRAETGFEELVGEMVDADLALLQHGSRSPG
jgi:GDPmannose 4,6-dehydratase